MLWRLFRLAVELNMRRLWYFRASLALDLISSLAYVGVTILFWELVFGRVRALPGWTLGQTYALVAFAEFFYALSMSVFVATGKLWSVIISGRIDIYLIRPADPRLIMSAVNLRLENLLRAVPSITLLAIMAGRNGARVTLLSVLVSLLIAMLGAATYAGLQLAGSWASFWLGRTQMLDELTDSLTELTRYPHTILPNWVRLALLTVVPLSYAASEPSRVLFGGSVGWALSCAATVAASWWAVQEILWKRGLKRYDSFGG